MGWNIVIRILDVKPFETKNIEMIQRKYLDYPFNVLESQLIDFNNVENLVIEDVSIEHILFIIKQEAHTSLENRTPNLDLISQQALDILPKYY